MANLVAVNHCCLVANLLAANHHCLVARAWEQLLTNHYCLVANLGAAKHYDLEDLNAENLKLIQNSKVK